MITTARRLGLRVGPLIAVVAKGIGLENPNPHPLFLLISTTVYHAFSFRVAIQSWKITINIVTYFLLLCS